MPPYSRIDWAMEDTRFAATVLNSNILPTAQSFKVTGIKFDEDGYDENGYWDHDETHSYISGNFPQGGYDRHGVN